MLIPSATVPHITAKSLAVILLAAAFYLYEFYMQIAPGVIQQELMHDFLIDATGLGLLSGCFYLSYTLFQLPAGLLLDRYSTRAILTSICATFALGVLMFGTTTNFYLAALARFIMGGAAACAFISVLHLIARWIPGAHFALFAGIVEMMGALGGYGGTQHLAVVLKQLPWRQVMVQFAGVGALLALLIYLFVRNNPTQHSPTTRADQLPNSIWHDLRSILGQAQTWYIACYSMLIWAPILGFSALWGVEFLRLGHHLDRGTAAQAVALVWLGIALASPTLGWLADLLRRKTLLMSICALLGCLSLSLVIFNPQLPGPLLCLLMVTIGWAGAGQTLSFALIKENNSPTTTSAANGFNNMVLVASGLCQPLIGTLLDLNWQGQLLDGIHSYSLVNYQTALLILPLCYGGAALISACCIKEPPRIAEPNSLT